MVLPLTAATLVMVVPLPNSILSPVARPVMALARAVPGLVRMSSPAAPGAKLIVWVAAREPSMRTMALLAMLMVPVPVTLPWMSSVPAVKMLAAVVPSAAIRPALITLAAMVPSPVRLCPASILMAPAT